MTNVSDIPKYVRYDFFMAVLGIIVAYFLFSNKIIHSSFELTFAFSIISASCLLYGILEMKQNYEKDKKLRELKRKLERHKLIAEINKIRNG